MARVSLAWMTMAALVALAACAPEAEAPAPTGTNATGAIESEPGEAAEDSPLGSADAAEVTTRSVGEARDADAAPPPRRVKILYGVNRRAQLEFSGCRVEPLGGLARLATWLRTDPRAGEPGQRLLLDGGDTLLPSPPEPPEAKDLERAATVVALYGDVGFDALGLSARDLAIGAAHLPVLAERASFPFLAANLFDWETGAPAFKQGLLWEVSGVRVGVFALVEPIHGELDDERHTPWRIGMVAPAAHEQVARLREAGAEIVIALAHLRRAKIGDLLAGVDGIDVILFGSESDLPRQPEVVDGAVLIDPGGHGEHVGVLEIVLPHGVDAPGLVDGNARERLGAEIERVDARLKRLEADPALGDPELMASLRAERDLLALDLSEVEPAPAGRRSFEYHLVPLRPAVPEDPAIAGAVEALLDRIDPKRPRPDGPAP